MRGRKKAAKAGAGALAAGQAARSNEYVQRLIEDDSLRDDLRDAYNSAHKAYGRMSSRKGPTKALFDDRKTQRELRDAAESLRDAATTLRGSKRKQRGKRRGMIAVVLIGGAAAVALTNEGVRQKLLDTLFGAEEEFEYTSTTVPPAPTEPASATAGAS